MLRRSRARPRVSAVTLARQGTPLATEKRGGRGLVVALLISAAALDLTRCSMVLMTFRRLDPAAGLVAAGVGAAVLSVTAARGYRAGRRWATLVALLIGVASAPQASASGFRAPFTIPDVATAALGIVLAVAILATAGGGETPTHHVVSPCATAVAARRLLATRARRRW